MGYGMALVSCATSPTCVGIGEVSGGKSFLSPTHPPTHPATNLLISCTAHLTYCTVAHSFHPPTYLPTQTGEEDNTGCSSGAVWTRKEERSKPLRSSSNTISRYVGGWVGG